MMNTHQRLFTAFLLGSLFLFMVAPARGQAGENGITVRPEAGLSFMVGVPQGAFSSNVSDPGFGLDLYGGLGLAPSPFALGLDIGFLVYGRDVRNVPFSSTVGPAVTVDVVTKNNIAQSHLILRLQPQSGTVRPYVDGRFGFKYLFTETRVRDERNFDNEDIASSNNFDDFALSYGAGAGVAIRLLRPQTEPAEPGAPSIGTVELVIGAKYVLGSEADYLREGPIEDRNENGRLDQSELDIARSRTTLLEPHLGVQVRF